MFPTDFETFFSSNSAVAALHHRAGLNQLYQCFHNLRPHPIHSGGQYLDGKNIGVAVNHKA